LGDPTLAIEFAPWRDSLGANKCGPITYLANADSKVLDSSWIKFDPSTRKFAI
jgi:hypothetical protein